MTALLGGMALPLIGWSGEKMLIRGELREIIALRIEPAGLSLDALEAALVPEACEEIVITSDADSEGFVFSGYTYRAMLARDATGEDCIRIMMARPSERDMLQTVVDILTGEAE